MVFVKKIAHLVAEVKSGLSAGIVARIVQAYKEQIRILVFYGQFGVDGTIFGIFRKL